MVFVRSVIISSCNRIYSGTVNININKNILYYQKLVTVKQKSEYLVSVFFWKILGDKIQLLFIVPVKKQSYYTLQVFLLLFLERFKIFEKHDYDIQ